MKRINNNTNKYNKNKKQGPKESEKRKFSKSRPKNDDNSDKKKSFKKYDSRTNDDRTFSGRGREKNFDKKKSVKKYESTPNKDRSFSDNEREDSLDKKRTFKRKDSKSDKEKRFSGKEGENKENKRTFKKYDSKFDKDKKNTKQEDSKNRFSRSKKTVSKPFDDKIRLNKYIANAGICSRREADELIKTGLVEVNGEIITEMGYKVNPGDNVKMNNSLIKQEKPVYILMNKPKDTLTSATDDRGRRTVIDLIGKKVKQRIFPVGRLDRNTTGVLLLTNDGDLAKKLSHPKYNKKKIYHVHLDKKVIKEDMYKFSQGIELDDGFMSFDSISYVSADSKTEVGVEIHSGKNRIVRRMFESFDYKVKKLDRVYFAGLTKKGLGRGYWRYLTEKELRMLKTGSHE